MSWALISMVLSIFWATSMKAAVSKEERGASSNGAISDSGMKTSCPCRWTAGISDEENLRPKTTKHTTQNNLEGTA